MQPVKYIWMDGSMVPWEHATTHVLAHGLHYGTGVFEGIRAYSTTDGPAVFRLTEHMQRLILGAKAYRIPVEWPLDDLVKVGKEIISINQLNSGYIRPLIFYGTGSMGLNPVGAQVHAIVAAWEWGAYLGDDGLSNGIRVGLSSWRRIDHNMLHPNAKGSGGYINSVLAKQEALLNGFDEAIMLNRDGFLAEGSGENLFLVRNGSVTTPPVTAGVLEGITRHTVITLLREDGCEVLERRLTRSDLYYANEAFLTGTAAEVTPIREVDHLPVGDGRPGPVTRRVQELFMAAVTGRDDRHRDWLEYA